MAKICPLLKTQCVEDCAWWNECDEQCAILGLSMGIDVYTHTAESLEELDATPVRIRGKREL